MPLGATHSLQQHGLQAPGDDAIVRPLRVACRTLRWWCGGLDTMMRFMSCRVEHAPHEHEREPPREIG